MKAGETSVNGRRWQKRVAISTIKSKKKPTKQWAVAVLSPIPIEYGRKYGTILYGVWYGMRDMV